MLSTLLLLLSSAHADCAPVDLARTTQEARRLLDDAEAPQALAQVVQAEQGLPCLDQLATKDALAALFRVGGTAALSAGDEEEARRLFATAARLAGEVVFDTSLGGPAEEMYWEQLDFVRSMPTSTVLAHEPTRLDGWDLPVGEAQHVAAGAHLVQRIAPDGVVRSSVETVAPGAQLAVGEVPPLVEERSAPNGRTGVVISGAALVAGGGACLFAAGAAEENLGELRGQYGYYWPEPAVTEQERLVRNVNILQGCGVAGLGLGVTLLGGSFILTNNSLTVTSTW